MVTDMNFRQRWQARETKAGKWIKNWIGKLLLFCTAVGSANDYFSLIPTDFVPNWVKAAVPICGLVGFVAGKMTAKKETVAVLLISIMLLSCGANAKLQHAKKLIAQAEAMGAKVSHDTVWKEKRIEGVVSVIKLPGVVRDTVIYKDRVYYKITHVRDTMRIEAKCPDEVIKTPTAISTTITCPPTADQRWKWVGIGAGIMVLIIVCIGYGLAQIKKGGV